MELLSESTITLSPTDIDNDVTLKARHFEMGTTINLNGDIRIILDQIAVSPSDSYDGNEVYCGVCLNYTRQSKHDTHLATMFTISPEDERRLVEWLHTNGAKYVIETPEYNSESIEYAHWRGECAYCGEWFNGDCTPAVTIHNEDAPDKRFCSYDCSDEFRTEALM